MNTVTDDFKIMTNRAIECIKSNNQDLFVKSVKYILKESARCECEDYAIYLYKKLQVV